MVKIWNLAIIKNNSQKHEEAKQGGNNNNVLIKYQVYADKEYHGHEG